MRTQIINFLRKLVIYDKIESAPMRRIGIVAARQRRNGGTNESI